MIASLELDIPAFAQHAVEIVDVKLSLLNGIAKSMSEDQVPKLPIVCQARDQLVCLYSLTPSMASLGLPSQPTAQSLDVIINARVMMSESCHPRVEVRFKANVDFVPPPKPGISKAAQPVQQTSKPVNFPAGSDKLLDQPGTTPEDSKAPTQEKMGIVVKFTAKGEVYVGEPFQWEVFVINRSPNQRKLGLAMLYRRKSNGEKRLSSRPTSVNAPAANNKDSTADGFVDDNLLYTMIKSQAPEATQLVCLNTDVRIG